MWRKNLERQANCLFETRDPKMLDEIEADLRRQLAEFHVSNLRAGVMVTLITVALVGGVSLVLKSSEASSSATMTDREGLLK